ncbi:hypothetical protein IWQ61_006654 [Dispira simplex]|nr:hypothetical protein IWQ61_006654 [Dispira simplex]
MGFTVYRNTENLRHTPHAELVHASQAQALQAKRSPTTQSNTSTRSTNPKSVASSPTPPSIISNRSARAQSFHVAQQPSAFQPHRLRSTSTRDGSCTPTQPSPTHTRLSTTSSGFNTNPSEGTSLLPWVAAQKVGYTKAQRPVTLYMDGTHHYSSGNLVHATKDEQKIQRRLSFDAGHNVNQPDLSTPINSDRVRGISSSSVHVEMDQGQGVGSPVQTQTHTPRAKHPVDDSSACRTTEAVSTNDDPSIEPHPRENCKQRSNSILSINSLHPSRSSLVGTSRPAKTLVISPTMGTPSRKLGQFLSGAGTRVGSVRQMFRAPSNESATVQEVMHQMELINRDFTVQISEYQDFIIKLESDNKELVAENEELKKRLRKLEYQRVNEVRTLDQQLRNVETQYRDDMASLKTVHQNKMDEMLGITRNLRLTNELYRRTLETRGIPLPTLADSVDFTDLRVGALDDHELSDRLLYQSFDLQPNLSRNWSVTNDARLNHLFTSIDDSLSLLQQRCERHSHGRSQPLQNSSLYSQRIQRRLSSDTTQMFIQGDLEPNMVADRPPRIPTPPPGDPTELSSLGLTCVSTESTLGDQQALSAESTLSKDSSVTSVDTSFATDTSDSTVPKSISKLQGENIPSLLLIEKLESLALEQHTGRTTDEEDNSFASAVTDGDPDSASVTILPQHTLDKPWVRPPPRPASVASESHHVKYGPRPIPPLSATSPRLAGAQPGVASYPGHFQALTMPTTDSKQQPSPALFNNHVDEALAGLPLQAVTLGVSTTPSPPPSVSSLGLVTARTQSPLSFLRSSTTTTRNSMLMYGSATLELGPSSTPISIPVSRGAD